MSAGIVAKSTPGEQKEDGFLNRKEIARFLRIPQVTLTNWMKPVLHSHKQRTAYFYEKRVKDHIKGNQLKQLKFGSGFQHLSQKIPISGMTKKPNIFTKRKNFHLILTKYSNIAN
jgi:hypothetical protein